MPRKLREIDLGEFDLSGFSILITGANTGIGWQLARLYLTLCADIVYLAVRDIEKGEQAKKRLLEEHMIIRRNPGGRVCVYQVDLSSLDSVTSFCKKFCKEVKILHIAVLNAGVTLVNYRPTVDGMEESFQVNFFSNAILSAYLVPLLQSNSPSKRELTERLYSRLPTGSKFETLPSHLTWVSSTMHLQAKIARRNPIPIYENIIDWFNDEANMSYERFRATKFLVTAYASELGARVGSKNLVINSACPGFVRSGYDRHFIFVVRRILRLWDYFTSRSTTEGALAIAWATLSGPEGNAQYYSDGTISRSSSYLHKYEGKLFQSQLWDQTKLYMHRIDREIPVRD